MSLIASDNGPSPNHFYWNASGGGGGGGGVSGLIGTASGSVATTSSTPVIRGTGGISVVSTTSNVTIGFTGSAGVVPSVVDVQASVYWTQQTFIPSSGNSQSIVIQFGGSGSTGGNVTLPATIQTALSNSAYSTLRIDGTLPIYEDQSDAGGLGNYYQTALQCAGADASARFSFPSTQFHPILSVSGTGITGDQGLLNGGSCFSYPFSLVLTKGGQANLTTNTTAIVFKLNTTSSSNAKFYIGGSVATTNNVSPIVFTLSP